jgi:hypothetical protein
MNAIGMKNGLEERINAVGREKEVLLKQRMEFYWKKELNAMEAIWECY